MDSSTDTFQRRTLGRRFYPAVILDQILAQVAKGRSVVEICADPQFPAASSFYNWCASDDTLKQKYLSALVEAQSAKRQGAAA
jgi:hypothetical protein